MNAHFISLMTFLLTFQRSSYADLEGTTQIYKEWPYPNYIVDPPVDCPFDGFFPHPRNCSWFYRCHSFLMVPNLYHHRFYFQCGPGTVFDDSLDQCVWGSWRNCPNFQATKITKAPACPTCLVDLQDCKHFTVCPDQFQKDNKVTLILCEQALYSADERYVKACSAGEWFQPSSELESNGVPVVRRNSYGIVMKRISFYSGEGLCYPNPKSSLMTCKAFPSDIYPISEPNCLECFIEMKQCKKYRVCPQNGAVRIVTLCKFAKKKCFPCQLASDICGSDYYSYTESKCFPHPDSTRMSCLRPSHSTAPVATSPTTTPTPTSPPAETTTPPAETTTPPPTSLVSNASETTTILSTTLFDTTITSTTFPPSTTLISITGEPETTIVLSTTFSDATLLSTTSPPSTALTSIIDQHTTVASTTPDTTTALPATISDTTLPSNRPTSPPLLLLPMATPQPTTFFPSHDTTLTSTSLASTLSSINTPTTTSDCENCYVVTIHCRNSVICPEGGLEASHMLCKTANKICPSCELDTPVCEEGFYYSLTDSGCYFPPDAVENACSVATEIPCQNCSVIPKRCATYSVCPDGGSPVTITLCHSAQETCLPCGKETELCSIEEFYSPDEADCFPPPDSPEMTCSTTPSSQLATSTSLPCDDCYVTLDGCRAYEFCHDGGNQTTSILCHHAEEICDPCGQKYQLCPSGAFYSMATQTCFLSSELAGLAC